MIVNRLLLFGMIAVKCNNIVVVYATDCDWQRRERSRQRTGNQNDKHANPANPSVHTALRVRLVCLVPYLTPDMYGPDILRPG